MLSRITNAHSFSSFVSDSPFGTSADKPIDLFATSVMSNIKLQPSPKVFMKEIYDKKSYKNEFFQNLLDNCNWRYFYGQTCPEGMFSILTSFMENSLRKSISKKKTFIRNDKSNITNHQKWVSTETKRLYNKIRQDMNPIDLKYEHIQQQFIRNLN